MNLIKQILALSLFFSIFNLFQIKGFFKKEYSLENVYNVALEKLDKAAEFYSPILIEKIDLEKIKDFINTKESLIEQILNKLHLIDNSTERFLLRIKNNIIILKNHIKLLRQELRKSFIKETDYSEKTVNDSNELISKMEQLIAQLGYIESLVITK